MTIQPLNLNANQWRFLEKPEPYVAASRGSGRELVLKTTKRQFRTARDILARLNGSNGEKPRRGVLLADDVGLGKTTVAALVAWIVARAGENRGVRILAPNAVMKRRWEDELEAHVMAMQRCVAFLGVERRHVKKGRVARLNAGTIQVATHAYAGDGNRLACDLLIVDEAHRARGEQSQFSKELKKQMRHAKRILILTATPFSIRLDELIRMLGLVGGESANDAVRRYSRILDRLYQDDAATPGDAEKFANRLAESAKAAIDALGAFVIRHGVDELPDERKALGRRDDWTFKVDAASRDHMEIILRMVRALQIEKKHEHGERTVTNDPRFHVGWRHLDREADRLLQMRDGNNLIRRHVERVHEARKQVGVHPKIRAVGEEVRRIVESGEKVVLFCHHHATAAEVAVHLQRLLPNFRPPASPTLAEWKGAWKRTLAQPEDTNAGTMGESFIVWLCSPMVRAQTWSWFGEKPTSVDSLVRSLKETRSRHGRDRISIAEAADHLFRSMRESASTRGVLAAAGEKPELIPGGQGTARVLAVCDEPEGSEDDRSILTHNRQPDTVLAVFNSPFGPDALVATDKLSEGIDMHRYCRHLIHYELDPSPIRTVQRNGRLRRVNSWAAITGEPILYAYPAFGGTRDERLVRIMKKRIDSFSLLLGGVRDIHLVDGSDDHAERWRNEVVAIAKKRLSAAGASLRTKVK